MDDVDERAGPELVGRQTEQPLDLRTRVDGLPERAVSLIRRVDVDRERQLLGERSVTRVRATVELVACPDPQPPEAGWDQRAEGRQDGDQPIRCPSIVSSSWSKSIGFSTKATAPSDSAFSRFVAASRAVITTTGTSASTVIERR